MLSLKSKSANSQTFYNVVSTIIRTGVSFFTIPIFTRILGTEQYGLYSLYLSWYNVLSCAIALGCGQGISTGMYAFKDDYPKFRSSILVGGTLMCAISTTIGIVIFRLLSGIISYSFSIFLLLFLESTASFVIGFAGSAWTYEKKAAHNMVLSVATLLSTTGLSLLLLFLWGKEDSNSLYIARILGVAIPTIIIASLVWCIIFFQSPTGYVKKYWLYSFCFGIPTIFHSLSHQVLASSDRIMMQWLNVSNSEIGIYSFFYSFVSILSAVLSALNNSWVPFLYEDLDKKNYCGLNKRVDNYVQIFTIITCVFILLSREVSKLFANQDYWSGMNVMPIIAIVVYLTFVYQFAVNYEFFKSKPRIIAYGTASAAVINIVFNIIMIPLWGMYGAAIATMLSYAFLAMIHFIVVMKWRDERYPLVKRPLLYGLIAVLGSCVLFYVLADFWLLRWTLGLVITLYLFVSVYKRRTIF